MSDQIVNLFVNVLAGLVVAFLIYVLVPFSIRLWKHFQGELHRLADHEAAIAQQFIDDQSLELQSTVDTIDKRLRSYGDMILSSVFLFIGTAMYSLARFHWQQNSLSTAVIECIFLVLCLVYGCRYYFQASLLHYEVASFERIRAKARQLRAARRSIG